ncbi:MAG: hypothetical protein ACRERR_03920 [Moraxellaceae bacterium]
MSSTRYTDEFNQEAVRTLCRLMQVNPSGYTRGGHSRNPLLRVMICACWD